MKKAALFVASIIALSAISTQAFAQRSGLYVEGGINVGGGSLKLINDKNGDTTAEFDRKIDGGLLLGAGYAINEMFVPGLIFGWTGQQTDGPIGLGKVFMHNINGLVGLDFFPFMGIVAGFHGGVAYSKATWDGNGGNVSIKKDGEVGWAVRGSAGYEMMFGNNLAVGARFFYLYNKYDGKAYDTLGGSLVVRWY